MPPSATRLHVVKLHREIPEWKKQFITGPLEEKHQIKIIFQQPNPTTQTPNVAPSRETYEAWIQALSEGYEVYIQQVDFFLEVIKVLNKSRLHIPVNGEQVSPIKQALMLMQTLVFEMSELQSLDALIQTCFERRYEFVLLMISEAFQRGELSSCFFELLPMTRASIEEITSLVQTDAESAKIRLNERESALDLNMAEFKLHMMDDGIKPLDWSPEDKLAYIRDTSKELGPVSSEMHRINPHYLGNLGNEQIVREEAAGINDPIWQQHSRWDILRMLAFEEQARGAATTYLATRASVAV